MEEGLMRHVIKGLKREVNVDEMENGGKEKIENEELLN
jgi:hypothetical protein